MDSIDQLINCINASRACMNLGKLTRDMLVALKDSAELLLK